MWVRDVPPRLVLGEEGALTVERTFKAGHSPSMLFSDPYEPGICYLLFYNCCTKFTPPGVYRNLA